MTWLCWLGQPGGLNSYYRDSYSRDQHPQDAPVDWDPVAACEDAGGVAERVQTCDSLMRERGARWNLDVARDGSLCPLNSYYIEELASRHGCCGGGRSACWD